MKAVSVAISSQIYNHALGLCLLLCLLFAVQASAQSIVLPTELGTVQALLQDEGVVVISGRRYGWDDELVEVELRGEPVSTGVLDEGMVVRFETNAQGVLTHVEILGPFNEIRNLEQN